LQLYEDLARREPLPTIVHAAVIKAYLEAGRREQALACLEQAVKTAMYADAGTVRGAVGIARKYLAPDQLVGVLQKLIEQTPETTPEGLRLRSTLAVQLTEIGQVEEGLQVSQRVLGRAQVGSPEWGDAMAVRAQSLQRKGDLAGAIEAYRQVIERFPNEGSALNNLAFLLADEANRPAEALPYAEEARQLEPRNASYLDTLGWVYFKCGRFSEAEAHLKEALSIAADDAVTQYHLGMLYLDRGRLAEARPALQRAAELAAREKNSEFEQKVNRALEQLQ
jgi:tetratricopeptide (TPR) repeat protein